MRFSTSAAVVLSVLATNASAFKPGRWWIEHGAGSGITWTTIVRPAAPAAPTVPASVVKPQDPVQPTTTAAEPINTSGSNSGGSSLSSDEQNALDAHNSARKDVGVAALSWDAGLAADAQKWADHLVTVGSLTHSQTDNQGENLFMQYGSSSPPDATAAEMWIAEKSKYNGQPINSADFMAYGHYTQVVWSSTTKVGMALAKGNNGDTYVVARYSPPGNFIGSKPY